MSDTPGGGVMSPKHNDGNVKWPHFITSILGVLGIVILLYSFNISSAEFAQYEKRMDDRFDVVLNAIRDLKK